MGLPELLDILSKGGALGTCALLIWALLTERLVPGARLTEARADRAELVASVGNLSIEMKRSVDRIEKKIVARRVVTDDARRSR